MITTIINNTSKHFLKPLLADILVYLITAFYLILPAQPDNAELTVREVRAGDSGITYEIVNNTRRIIGKPDSFIMEKNIDGYWVEMSDTNIAMTDVAYTVFPGGFLSDTVWIYGFPESDVFPESNPLPSVSFDDTDGFEQGEYRLTVFYPVKSLKTFVQGKATAVFTVE